MFKFAKSLFSTKVKSVKEFAGIAKKNNYKVITIRPDRENTGLGKFKYIIEFTATNPAGQKIRYQDSGFNYEGGNCHWFFDAEHEWIAAIKIYLIAEKRTEELKTMLPGFVVKLIRPGLGADYDKAVDDAFLSRLYRDAVTYSMKE